MLAFLLAVRGLWRAPLNVDEELTLAVAQRSPGAIWRIVSNERGGGPLHFLLEHVVLQWPGGLAALRGPSLVCFLVALPAVALIARELVGTASAAVAVLLVAAAPLAVSYSTFGRPHLLLFAWLQWGTLLGLVAARRGGRWWWTATGAVLGTTVFVHPTAPLYALTAFAVALVWARRAPRELAGEAWPGALAFAVGFGPYYVKTLGVLGDRYQVGPGARSGRTFSGRPVWEDAVHFLSPGAGVVNYLTVLAVVGLGVLALRRGRAAVALGLTIAAPIVFFSVVPANGRSALFFDRYMLPAVPAFATLVAAGCVWLARRMPRFGPAALAVLVAVALVLEGRVVLQRQRDLGALALGRVTAAVADRAQGAVLFGSTGTNGRGGNLAAFTFGRPPNLLERYVSLRLRSLRVVDDDSCVPVVAFLRASRAPTRGLWLFYGARAGEAAAGARELRPDTTVWIEQPAPRYLLVGTRRKLPRRELVRIGMHLRQAWSVAVPPSTRSEELVVADGRALGGRCVPHGILGDPDIDPHNDPDSWRRPFVRSG